MLDVIKEMLTTQDMCVLATTSSTRSAPHCSLMAYITDDSNKKVYMVTHKNTKKFVNLEKNAEVCLLIDTRSQSSTVPRQNLMALTVNGVFQEIDNTADLHTLRNRFVQHHTQLHDFAMHPDAHLFSIKIESFQLLRGATDSFFIEIE